MMPIGVARGKFKMLKPCRSVQGRFILVGAIVDQAGVYSKRVKPDATRDDLRRAYALLREQIHKDNPGIKEEFTTMRPATHYN